MEKRDSETFNKINSNSPNTLQRQDLSVVPAKEANIMANESVNLIALNKNNLNSEDKSEEKKVEDPEEATISHLNSFKLYKMGKEYLKTEGMRLCNKIGFIYNFEVYKKGDHKPYYINVDLKNKPGKVSIGKNSDADCTVTAKDETLADIISKKLHPATAILQRKVTLKGKLQAIAKFRPEFFGIKPKL